LEDEESERMTKKERKERGGGKEQEESKDYNKTSRADFTLLNCLCQYNITHKNQLPLKTF